MPRNRSPVRSRFLPVTEFVLSVVNPTTLAGVLLFDLIPGTGAPGAEESSGLLIEVVLEPRLVRLLLILKEARDADEISPQLGFAGWRSRARIAETFARINYPIAPNAVSSYGSRIHKLIRKTLAARLGTGMEREVTIELLATRNLWGYRLPRPTTLRVIWPDEMTR